MESVHFSKERQRRCKAATCLGKRKTKSHKLAESHDVGGAVAQRRVQHQALLVVYNDVVGLAGFVSEYTPHRQEKGFRLRILQRMLDSTFGGCGGSLVLVGAYEVKRRRGAGVGDKSDWVEAS